MTRFGHRVKTHGRGWRHHQPVPGVYLWRTPHGYWCRVDQHGTHPLDHSPATARPTPRTARSNAPSHASSSPPDLQRNALELADLLWSVRPAAGHQAPQPMQVATSNAPSAASLGTGVACASEAAPVLTEM